MKKIISVIMCLLTVAGICAFTFVGASAAGSPELVMDETYDEDSKTITVKVTLTNAVGATSGVIDLVFDDEMCSYRKKDGFKSLVSSLTMEGGKTVDNTYECSAAFIAANSVTADDCDENGNLALCEFKFDVKGEYKQNSFYLYTDGIEINNSTKTVEPVGNTDMAPVKSTTANKAAKNNTSTKSDSKDSNTALFVIIAVAVLAAVAAITVAVSKKKKAKEADGKTLDTDIIADTKKEDTPDKKDDKDAEDK